MAKPTVQVVADYTTALTEIRDRLLAARATLTVGTDSRAVESAALDLRFALEGLLLSALITHKEDLGTITKALRKADAGDARKRVEDVNPDWWPNPQDVARNSTDKSAGYVATVTGHHDPDFMTSDDWGRSYGVVSDLLHAKNPFRAPRMGAHALRPQLQSIEARLWRLLKAHTLNTGSDDVLLLARFDEAAVEVGVLTKVAETPGE